MPPIISTTPSYQLYQELVNHIFGSDVISIKPDSDNNVIGSLKYQNEYLEFKKNLEARLIRLRDRYCGTSSYNDLLVTVAQVADHRNWEGAYAELVAYDALSNDYLPDVIELNKTLPAGESFAGEMGGSETNEDGFINEYNLYFDVKILADTVDGLLKGITDEAIKKAGQTSICDILPEYPLDDDEEEYQQNRNKIIEELCEFLDTNKPANNKGKNAMTSSVMPHLTFRINWGGGINSSVGEYNPYKHAEECKHMMYKRYTKKFMKSHPFMLVMVNFPWYNGRINSFIDADAIFYRSLARRTFCEYKNLSDPLTSIVPRFSGTETVFEVSKHLSGIVFIDDNSIKEDSYTFHIYMNPNANNKIDYGRTYLEQVVAKGTNRSLFDDMEHDNY